MDFFRFLGYVRSEVVFINGSPSIPILLFSDKTVAPLVHCYRRKHAIIISSLQVARKHICANA